MASVSLTKDLMIENSCANFVELPVKKYEHDGNLWDILEHD